MLRLRLFFIVVLTVFMVGCQGQVAPTSSEPTKATEATKAPEPTKVTEATKVPEPTKVTEATKVPEPTETPEPTKAPELTRAGIQNITISLHWVEDEKAAIAEEYRGHWFYIEILTESGMVRPTDFSCTQKKSGEGNLSGLFVQDWEQTNQGKDVEGKIEYSIENPYLGRLYFDGSPEEIIISSRIFNLVGGESFTKYYEAVGDVVGHWKRKP